MKPELESFGLWLENWILKVKREDDGMSRGYKKIDTYFTTQKIHQEIKSHQITTQREST